MSNQWEINENLNQLITPKPNRNQECDLSIYLKRKFSGTPTLISMLMLPGRLYWLFALFLQTKLKLISDEENDYSMDNQYIVNDMIVKSMDQWVPMFQRFFGVQFSYWVSAAT